ncbi:S41 family peptidase [Aureibacter tunicatorum]|uniref:Tail specific protease domain-containing protein n=1 Tax=Aureibacter tunicatorum TaxID=866807 RepID=A0AAE3XQ54_9BACT|nr:S41 family peptidase [Aureibacter tunicatorum]MDR6241986.1 hypothetical protein [Aureibacter tunicatorum]BDD07281.1 hypothetical protein AUTU_47640 [Aureibacter tunicatorum]
MKKNFMLILAFLAMGIISCDGLINEHNPSNVADNNFQFFLHFISDYYIFKNENSFLWQETYDSSKTILELNTEHSLEKAILNTLEKLQDPNISVITSFDTLNLQTSLNINDNSKKDIQNLFLNASFIEQNTIETIDSILKSNNNIVIDLRTNIEVPLEFIIDFCSLFNSKDETLYFIGLNEKNNKEIIQEKKLISNSIHKSIFIINEFTIGNAALIAQIVSNDNNNTLIGTPTKQSAVKERFPMPNGWILEIPRYKISLDKNLYHSNIIHPDKIMNLQQIDNYLNNN